MNEWEKLFAKAKELYAEAKTLLLDDEGDHEEAKKLQAKADELKERAKALKAVSGNIDDISEPNLPAGLPTEGDPDPMNEGKDDAVKAVYQMQYGDEDSAVKAILKERFGERFASLTPTKASHLHLYGDRGRRVSTT